MKDLNKLLNRIKLCVGVNTEKISEEVDRLLTIDTTYKGEDYREKLYGCIDYLEDINDFMDRLHGKNGKKEFKVNYNVVGNYVECSPLNITGNDEFEINIKDIIKIKDTDVLVVVDYSNVVSALGFDYVKDDLGYSYKDIEDELIEKSNIVGYNDSAILANMIADEDKDYHLMKEMKIGECDFMDSRRLRLYSYYGEDIENSDDKYKNILELNSKTTMHLILKYILEECGKKINIGVVSVEEDKINFICGEDELETLQEILNEGICINLFGRNFHFEPKIKLYRA